MTTTCCNPTTIGTRFETSYPKFDFYGPCPPTMMGNYPTPTNYGPWMTTPMPWTTCPHHHGWTNPQWCGPEQQCCYNSTFCNMPCRPTCQTELYCLNNPVRCLDREGNRMIYLCFDLRGFKPEEIQVTMNKTERSFTIESTHETKDGKEHHVQRKYCRKYCIPESQCKCDMSKCEPRSYLNYDGQLTIECQLPRMTPEEMSKCPTPSGYYNQPGCYTPVNCKMC